MVQVRAAFKRANSAIVVAALVLASVAVTVYSAPPSRADTAPVAGTPATVSADPLPTVQQNGVVWSQVTVGNIVYATGRFTQTWPAGTANTSANYTARSNLLAFDIRTGALVTSFNHSLNAQGLTIVASPDGTRIYVGGDFTQVDGQTRNHIAAFDVASGSLVSTFAPSVGSQVAALAATNSMVYAGGNFHSVGSSARTRLAAFTSAGALTSWAPTADDGNGVTALLVTPDQSEVVVGGSFSTLNGVSATGIGAVTTATPAATVPYAVNQYVHDCINTAANCYANPNSGVTIGSAITSLTTDGTTVYGSGYSWYSGNFEGTFGLDPDTGAIKFLNDCHGDTYGVQVVGSVLYSVSHVHECAAISGFPDTNPRINHHAIAFSTTPSGTNQGPDDYGWNYNGIPDSSILQWYPTMSIGSVTGQNQAAWAVTGNASYIALGGEFPTVNGKAQQGLVRFAVSSVAPNKVGPTAGVGLTPRATSLAAGTVRLTWQTDWDQDNATLTYNVFRDSGGAPVFTTTQTSNFWQLPGMGWTDTGVAAGSTHTYWVQAVDPFGNKLSGKSVTVTVSSSGQLSQYVKDVQNDGASSLWRFNESSGTTAYDWAGFTDLTNEGPGVADGTAGPLVNDPATAATFDGTGNGSASTQQAIVGPDTFSVESWFKTSSSSGGKIVGFGSSPSGSTSGSYDRHVYMDNSGHLIFGVYNGTTSTVITNKTYNDDAWHQVVGEMSSAGMVLYVDGVPVGQNGGVTSGQAYSGYWRIGGDSLGSWPNQPSSNYFNGAIADVAIYPTPLSVGQVQKHYTDAGYSLAVQPVPTDAYGSAVYNSGPTTYWRLNEGSGTTAADTSPYLDSGIYSGGVSYSTPSPVAGSGGTAVTLNGFNGLVSSSQSFNNPSVYSEEMWFNTTTGDGGKLIGFGSAQVGLSGSYDRHVYMLNSGQLEFGTYTGQTNTIVSPASYNDGHWHHMVATQGPAGMVLYVDGQSVGTNPQTQAQAYTGYWRVGGDNTWGGANSNYFAGSVDEVAIYGSQLTAAQVLAHYKASPAAVLPAPTATISTPSCSYLSCSFDGSGSTAPGGSISSYSWSFGDGSPAGSGATPSHVYSAAGTYSVTLTVTDSNNRTATASTSVTVTKAPAPSAIIATPSCSYLSCSFDGSGSTAPGGSISSYSWSFGDGSPAGSGATPSHVYSAAGTYSVTLTVTDSNGAVGTTTTSVSVTAPPGPPNALFTSTCTALSCTFDGTASSDPAGSPIASYAWTFAAGQTGTGATPSFTFATAGVYPVTLTVSNANGTNSVTHNVTVNPPANPVVTPYVSDNFNRSVSNGWGVATSGTTWSTVGSATNFSVANGVATITMPTAGSGPSVYASGVSTTDTSTLVTVTTSAPSSGNGVYVDVLGRRISSNTDYRGRLILSANGAVSVALFALNGGTSQTIRATYTIPGLTYTPGTQLNVQLQVTGTSPTTVRMKVWQAGAAYPSAWQVSATDSTATLQTAGTVGLVSYLAGNATQAPVSTRVSSFWSGPSVATPTAVAGTTCSALLCQSNGSSSTDPSGTVSSYGWSWGDGTVTTGATSSHTYAGPGTYTVTLTVTNPSGATSVATRQVTVPA